MGFMDLLNEIAEKSAEVIEREDGDYEQDGLLYCGKCHTPKQTTVELDGKTLTVSCLCECRQNEYDAEEERQRAESRVREAERLRRDGMQDMQVRGMTFSNDDSPDTKLSKLARRYVEKFSEMRERGKGLLLYGTVGTGKTFYAACIVNALIDKGVPCMMTNFSRLTTALLDADKKMSFLNDLDKYELLVIDDLSAERNTEYVAGTVQMVVDARYTSGKPLIVTTNLTADELIRPAEIRDKRLFSRLYDMCVPYEVKGGDRRKKALVDTKAEMEELLGL
jgi:DNA replication protein